MQSHDQNSTISLNLNLHTQSQPQPLSISLMKKMSKAIVAGANVGSKDVPLEIDFTLSIVLYLLM